MRLPVIALFLAALGVPAVAHHGFGEYDETRVVTLTGVVERLHDVNPHASVTVRVGAEVWTMELPSVAGLARFGVTADAFAVGATVTVKGYLHKKAKLHMRPEWIVRDGKDVQISPRAPRQPAIGRAGGDRQGGGAHRLDTAQARPTMVY